MTVCVCLIAASRFLRRSEVLSKVTAEMRSGWLKFGNLRSWTKGGEMAYSEAILGEIIPRNLRKVLWISNPELLKIWTWFYLMIYII